MCLYARAVGRGLRHVSVGEPKLLLRTSRSSRLFRRSTTELRARAHLNAPDGIRTRDIRLLRVCTLVPLGTQQQLRFTQVSSFASGLPVRTSRRSELTRPGVVSMGLEGFEPQSRLMKPRLASLYARAVGCGPSKPIANVQLSRSPFVPAAGPPGIAQVTQAALVLRKDSNLQLQCS